MPRPYLSRVLRQRIIGRADHRCEYCLLPDTWSAVPHHIDHILPLRHGGVSTEDNLAYACFECNLGKGANIGAFDPHSGQLTRLYHPRIDLWQTHFALDDGQIFGLDAIGRATAALLRFNQTLRVRQRRLLIAANRFSLPND